MMKHCLTFLFGCLLLVGLHAPLAPAASAQAGTDVHVVRSGDTLFSISRSYNTTVAELRALNDITGDNIRIGQRLIVRRGTAVRDEAPPPRPDLVEDEFVDEEPPAAAEPEPYVEVDEVRADVGESLPGVRPTDLVAPEPIPTGPPPPPPPPATLTRLTIGVDGVQPLPTERLAAGEAASGVHVVRPGETLSALARRYSTTVDALRRANRLTDDLISVGQELVVPGGAGAAVPIARPGRYDVRRSVLPDDEVHMVVRGETLFSIAARYGTTAGRLLALNTVTTGPLEPGKILVLPDGVGRTHHREAPPPRVDEEGLALVYPQSYVGRTTISGEPYDPDALTASHRELPFGTVLLVTAPASGGQVLVRINDRGPVSEGFLIELSAASAATLGLTPGSAERVQVKVLR